MRPYGGWGVWGGGSARPWVLHCASVAPDGLRYGGDMEDHGLVAPGGI